MVENGDLQAFQFEIILDIKNHYTTKKRGVRKEFCGKGAKLDCGKCAGDYCGGLQYHICGKVVPFRTPLSGPAGPMMQMGNNL